MPFKSASSAGFAAISHTSRMPLVLQSAIPPRMSQVSSVPLVLQSLPLHAEPLPPKAPPAAVHTLWYMTAQPSGWPARQHAPRGQPTMVSVKLVRQFGVGHESTIRLYVPAANVRLLIVATVPELLFALARHVAPGGQALSIAIPTQLLVLPLPVAVNVAQIGSVTIRW